jgi:undecaprenyl-diphosphatase
VIGWFEAIVLGLVQGLTEFLPISSTAHVLVISQVFGWEDPGAAFTAVMQIGTECAVLIYFRHDIVRIVSTWARSLVRPELRSEIDARMGWYVIVGTIPIAVLGFAFRDVIETAARNLWLVATVLIVFGLVLGVADRFGAKTRALTDLDARSGVLFGFGQALALIPGVSRSGATISAGLFLGFTREAPPATPSSWPSRPCSPPASSRRARSATAARWPGARRSSRPSSPSSSATP